MTRNKRKTGPQIEEKMESLKKIKSMLSIIALPFTGTIILAGDTNINVNEPSRHQKRYQEILENFSLLQHTNLPTRKGTKIIDHIIPNIPNKILYSNVLLRPSISDFSALYIIAKIPTIQYQSRYKYIDDFKQLLISIVYSFDNPDDQRDTLNKTIL